MSILAALAKAYERLHEKGEIARFGYATKDIHACLVIDPNGQIVGGPVLWHRNDKGKPSSRKMDVPYFGGRSGSKAPPYFLWDNTAYVLGVTAKENFDAKERNKAFVQYHIERISQSNDVGLLAFRLFLLNWRSEAYADFGFPKELLDRNIVFRLETDRNFIHERPAAGNRSHPLVA